MGSGWLGSGWFGSGWLDALGSGWTPGTGGSSVFAMRADRPLAAIPVPPNFLAKFRDSEWDPDLLALTVLPEFLTVKIGGKTWDQAIVLPPPAAVVNQAMIDDLLMLAVTERPEAMGEIVQQDQNFQLCWLQLLNINRQSNPATFMLMKLAARVGELVMIILKRQNRQRARPSQICPTLYPPIPVPGHSTYPAGHALIGSLTSECLAADVVPSHRVALEKLAERVGFNRVIAGLHFREDVDVGADIGRKLHPFIRECSIYKHVVLPAAQAEWS